MSKSSEPAANLGSALGLMSTVTVVKSGSRAKDPVSKAEPSLLRSNALTVDDSQTTVFDTLGKGKLVKPTYDPVLMTLLTHQNNTLMQCIAAMEVNIDGTGYEIERADGETITDADKAKIAQIKQFFDEPYPGMSFVSMRRAARRDMESVGYGAYEVIRNVGGEIVFLRRLDAKLLRLVLLDDPVLVEKQVTRMGKTTTVKMMARERRYCMQVGTKLRFFKEYGCSRDVDMITGEWLDKSGNPQPGTSPIDAGYNVGNPGGAAPGATGSDGAPQVVKGNEVLVIGVVPDVGTGYHVPRWVNQIPSVLGSRKAEEFNLEFFNSGGLPPALVLVQGGQLSPESRTALTNYLSGKAKYKQRGIIAEVYPASGDIGSAGSVKVTVERFGDERQKDSMFAGYDERCSERVRQAFRLPPLFVGKSQDQNFATAYASYMVAEAQVFKPEREEFDEIINLRVMKEIAPDYVFRSLPLQIQDVANQLKALEMAKDLADPESLLKEINEIGSVTLTAREDLDEENAVALVKQMLGRDTLGSKLDREGQKGPDGKPLPKEKPAVIEGDKKGRIAKMDDDVLRELADDWTAHLSGYREYEPASVKAMTLLIKSLAPGVRTLFNGYVAMKLADAHHDVGGTAHLIAAAGECLHREPA